MLEHIQERALQYALLEIKREKWNITALQPSIFRISMSPYSYIAIILEKHRGVRYISVEQTTKYDGFKYPIYIITREGLVYALKLDSAPAKLIKIKHSRFKTLLSLADYGYLEDELQHPYAFGYVSLAKGYNEPDALWSSCMSGYGHRFEPLEDVARMLVMRDYKGRAVARCVLWYAGSVYCTHSDTPLDYDCADKLYYCSEETREALLEYLKDNGIGLLWRDGYGNFSFGERYIKAPKKFITNIRDRVCALPWMDTFNHLSFEDEKLYCYDWKSGGYDRDDVHFGEHNVTHVLLSTEGGWLNIYGDDTDIE